MSFLKRIDEKLISTYQLFGEEIQSIEQMIKSLIDIMMNEKSSLMDYGFFDIRGTVLLYGTPGVGKTSLMNNCMKYALEKYQADCYELATSQIVEADLGKATKNLNDALQEFEDQKKGVLFIDEIDRICISRKYDEISELKRMLIEFMQFFDKQKPSNKKVILCCTNVINQIDEALIRRFSICKEIGNPSRKELLEFANTCMKKAGYKGKVVAIKEKTIITFDDLKRVFRNNLLLQKETVELFGLEVF